MLTSGSYKLLRAITCGVSKNIAGDRILLMLVGFFDESAKRDSNSGTFVLGGYVASTDNWDSFIPEWQAALAGEKVPVYDWVRYKKNIKRNPPFHEIIKKHVSGSIFSVIDIGDLHKAVEDTKWPEGFFPDLEALKKRAKNPYHIAVKHLLIMLAEKLDVLRLSGPIFTVFDEKTEKASVLSAYKYLKYTSNGKINEQLAGISFMDDTKAPPLQAADFYAGWSRQAHMEGKDLRKSHPYPWEATDDIPALMQYHDYNFFMKEFEAVCAPENLGKFIAYEASVSS